MNYLVDTDWVADYLNGISTTIERLNQMRVAGLALSVMTYGEIFDGISSGGNSRQAERVFQQFLRRVTVLPLTTSILKRFAHQRSDLRHRGQLIGDSDLLIAATALHHNLTLLTRNRRDFGHIPSLSIWQEGQG